jgi:predicted ArsR family transcriptional regulator
VSRWDRQFFATTRGQIVTILRRTRQTVDDLAARLGLTDNAVRAHLSHLERDGLVQQRGMRRGERRPALVYELTPEAEELFPKAYAPALGRFLDVLAEHAPREETERWLRETGRRLAAVEHPASAAAQASPAEGDPVVRLQAAAHALASLGGLAEVHVRDDETLEVRGFSCPLGEVVAQHPEVCRLAEAFVAEVSGLDVTERCDRSEPGRPRCGFDYHAAGEDHA